MRQMTKGTENHGNTEMITGHISKEEWMKFSQGVMSPQEEEELYTHVGTCTYCAEQFANIVEVDFFAEPPKYLFEEIIDRSKRADVQAAVTVRKTSKKMKLLFYSLKVGFAVAASIFLLTMTTVIQETAIELPKEVPVKTEMSVTKKLNQGSSEITSRLQDITNQVFRFEWKEKKK